MFDCEYRHWEYNHSTCTAFNCNMGIWALNSNNAPLILCCQFSYAICRMKMIDFSFQNISTKLYYYRQFSVQWNNIAYELIKNKKRNGTEQYSVEKVRYCVKNIILILSLYVKLDALRALTRASYCSTKSCFTSSRMRIDHNKHK